MTGGCKKIQNGIDNRCLLRFFSGVHPRIIIPARYNSGRLPGKALVSIAGKTLLEHVWQRGRDADLGTDPIIATDSHEIEKAARDFGAQVVMTSSLHRCGSERVAEAARGLDEDLIINLQGDEAFVKPDSIALLPAVFDDPDVKMATLVAPIMQQQLVHKPSVVKVVMDQDANALYFSRSPIPHAQTGSSNCYGHIGVYAFRKDFLLEIYSRNPGKLELAEGLEQLRVLEAGFKIKTIMVEASHFGVNTYEDLHEAEALGDDENPMQER